MSGLDMSGCRGVFLRWWCKKIGKGAQLCLYVGERLEVFFPRDFIFFPRGGFFTWMYKGVYVPN